MYSTNSCKGVALILLLWHHLFDEHHEFDFITLKIAFISKVCVAIFVILSGYGFSESLKFKNVGLLSFYKKRLLSLFSNYWLIALIFIPIGAYVFSISFHDVFNSHPYAKFIIQLSGLHRFVYDEYGFNPTWWYMSVITPLIFLFPFIYDMVKKYGVIILICFFCLLLPIPNKPIFPVINTWLLPFALGIFLSQNNYIVAISNKFNKLKAFRFVLLFIAIALVSEFRSYKTIFFGTNIDWLLGTLIILFVFELTTVSELANKYLSFLGIHLFNIFLFHTFIFAYWFKPFIYSFKNPLLIFIVLITICIAISILLEQFKKVIHFNKIVRKIINLKIPSAIEIPFNQVRSAKPVNKL